MIIRFTNVHVGRLDSEIGHWLEGWQMFVCGSIGPESIRIMVRQPT